MGSMFRIDALKKKRTTVKYLKWHRQTRSHQGQADAFRAANLAVPSHEDHEKHHQQIPRCHRGPLKGLK